GGVVDVVVVDDRVRDGTGAGADVAHSDGGAVEVFDGFDVRVLTHHDVHGFRVEVGDPAEIVDRLTVQVLQVTVEGVCRRVVLGQARLSLLLKDLSQVVGRPTGLHVVDCGIGVGAEDVGELTAQRVVRAGRAAGDELQVGDEVVLAAGLDFRVALGVTV